MTEEWAYYSFPGLDIPAFIHYVKKALMAKTRLAHPHHHAPVLGIPECHCVHLKLPSDAFTITASMYIGVVSGGFLDH
jgi:hypothetical protein